MVDDGRGEDSAQPTTNSAHIAQLRRSLDCPQHEGLQDIFGGFGAAQPPLQETQDLPTALHKSAPHRGISRLGGRVMPIIAARAVFWILASHRSPLLLQTPGPRTPYTGGAECGGGTSMPAFCDRNNVGAGAEARPFAGRATTEAGIEKRPPAPFRASEMVISWTSDI